jgi:hypothetical protein
VAATSAPVTVSFTKTISGTVSGPLRVLSGQSVSLEPGAQVYGPVTVDAGGALEVDGVTIGGPLKTRSAASVSVCNATVFGPFEAIGDTGPVLAGSGTAACPASHFFGPVTLQGNRAGAQIVGATVEGPLTVTGNIGTVVDSPNIVHGPSHLQ